MDNINDLLNSISPQDMEKLKSVASSLMSNKSAQQQETPTAAQNTDGMSALFGSDTTDMLMKVATQMNRGNDKTAFIKALQPLLSEERRVKADEAMKFLRLMDTLPLLKGLF